MSVNTDQCSLHGLYSMQTVSITSSNKRPRNHVICLPAPTRVCTAHSPDTTPVVEHFGIFLETHPKQSQHDVSLREWWPVGMPGFVKISVISNVG